MQDCKFKNSFIAQRRGSVYSFGAVAISAPPQMSSGAQFGPKVTRPLLLNLNSCRKHLPYGEGQGAREISCMCNEIDCLQSVTTLRDETSMGAGNRGEEWGPSKRYHPFRK